MTSSTWLVQSAGSALLADVAAFETAEQIIKIGIAALSLMLFALSLSAYRRTGLRRLLYAATAFGLFAVQTLVEFLEDTVGIGSPYSNIISPGITLAILFLFFLAIVSKESTRP